MKIKKEEWETFLNIYKKIEEQTMENQGDKTNFTGICIDGDEIYGMTKTRYCGCCPPETDYYSFYFEEED